MGELTNIFINYADSLGTQIHVILNRDQIRHLRNHAPEEFHNQFNRLTSDDLKELPVVVIVGVFGYDDHFAKFKHQKQNVGFTGIHQNYWKITEEIGKQLLLFLEDKGFKGKLNGEGILPIKYILNKLGIGRFGKNSLIYTKNYGSYINNWVELVTNAPLESMNTDIGPDLTGLTMCSKCNACLTHCPTKAIYEPYKVDFNRCITHLTHRVEIFPKDLFPKMENWIWGCNMCQSVCPVNAKVTPRKRHPDAAITHPGPGGKLPPAHKNPFPKLGKELIPEYEIKYLQNVLIALSNCGQSDDIQGIKAFSKTKKGMELREYCDYALDRLEGRKKTN